MASAQWYIIVSLNNEAGCHKFLSDNFLDNGWV